MPTSPYLVGGHDIHVDLDEVEQRQSAGAILCGKLPVSAIGQRFFGNLAQGRLVIYKQHRFVPFCTLDGRGRDRPDTMEPD
jgi:hypothetical protein